MTSVNWAVLKGDCANFLENSFVVFASHIFFDNISELTTRSAQQTTIIIRITKLLPGKSPSAAVLLSRLSTVTTSSHHCRRNHKSRRNTWHGYLPGTGAHGHESILPPSGKKCPVRGGFRFLRSARRPDPVCNC